MEEEYGAETMGNGDPANADFDVLGKVIEDEAPRYSAAVGDGTGTKIDYSREPPVPF